MNYFWSNTFDVLAITLTVTQTNEILALIQGICTIVFLIAGFILKFITWYKSSKADGKITKEEVKEIVDEAIDTTAKISNEISDLKDISKKDE